MAKKYPDVPKPKLVGPNTLSAPGAVKDYVPRVMATAGKYLDVIGSHDYDPRGDRWGGLRKLARTRPVWVTEWCPRTKDTSPGMINSATEYGVAMHEAFQGGANVFMAYDWVYPPRDSGEALIHVNWGNDYTLTKPYHLVSQWAEPLKPGMRVVETGVIGRAAVSVKPTAFLAADSSTLVIHIVNSQDNDAAIALKLTGKYATATTAARKRTSAREDAVTVPALTGVDGAFVDTLPARSFVTYRFDKSAN